MKDIRLIGHFLRLAYFERLDDGHHAWSKLGAGCGLEVFEEVLANIREAIQTRIEDSLADNEDIPQAETANFTMLRLIL
ncbi:MAG: hypothetical protein AB1715_09290 [Acidobacteriota bacterium]